MSDPKIADLNEVVPISKDDWAHDERSQLILAASAVDADDDLTDAEKLEFVLALIMRPAQRRPQ